MQFKDLFVKEIREGTEADLDSTTHDLEPPFSIVVGEDDHNNVEAYFSEPYGDEIEPDSEPKLIRRFFR